MNNIYLIKNPEVFQGEKYLNKNKNYFEGWYFKNTNAEKGISFIPGINIEGDIFMAKVGTTLRNGYTIDDITQTYLSAVKDNERDILYFSAGGILEQEPVASAVNMKGTATGINGTGADNSTGPTNARGRRINVTQGIPSLGQGMFIR